MYDITTNCFMTDLASMLTTATYPKNNQAISHVLPSRTWKNLVWNRVKAQPILRSSSCRASTLRDSFSFGSTRVFMAARISRSVMAEKRERKMVCGGRKEGVLLMCC